MSLTLALSSDQLNTDLGEDGSLFDMLRFIIDLYFLIGALFFTKSTQSCKKNNLN